jgi:hypothetical protein
VFNDFFSENRAAYEIIWKHIVEPDRPQMTVWRMRFVYWITKASDAHSEYVILIAFHGNNSYTNAPQCYGLRTLVVLFELSHFHASLRVAHHECQRIFIQVC